MAVELTLPTISAQSMTLQSVPSVTLVLGSVLNIAPTITTNPTISGTAKVGETLTATAGDTTGTPPPTSTLQWQRSDNGTSGWSDISGATGTTYVLVSADETKYLRVEQTATNIEGSVTATSASTSQVQPAFTGLLDTYSGASAAYSLRLLRGGYKGSAIRVRRSDDNEEQDIGFRNNELDTSTLETFSLGSDCFVTTWYDQSGNDNNATQTTAADQAKIVSGGTTINEGGKPSIDFLGSQYFSYGSIAFGNNANIVAVVKSDAESPTGIFAVAGDAGGVNGMPIWNFQNKYTSFNSTTSNKLQDSASATNKYAVLQAGRNTSSQSYMRINGTDFSITPTSQDTNSRSYLIGSITTTQYGYDGRISEFIVYNQNMYSNIANIETNINDHYSIY